MKPITRKDFSLAETVRNRYAVTVDPGATLEDVLKEESTQHIAASLRIGDILEVTPADQSWYAELMVKDCGRNFAKFHTLQFVELVPTDPVGDVAKSDAYTTSWGGPHQKHRVVRKADGAVLKDGFTDKRQAEAWIVEHEKAVA